MISNPNDHALLAAAYLQSASELARQSYEWGGEGERQAYAATLAQIGTAEAILALVKCFSHSDDPGYPVGGPMPGVTR